MGAGDLIVVPETATISEAAALLCRGLSQGRSEDRLSRGSSQDVIAALTGQAPPAPPQQDDADAKSSSSSTEASSAESEAEAAATLTRWEDWFTLASFSHPHVMSRLERLMGTNVVRITDRKYMLELQRRIREDHVRSVRERIRAREVDELEREKKLILDGRMSLDEAPRELVDHPVFQISQFIKQVLLEDKVPAFLLAPRNHVQPERLCEVASNVSRSTSSRAAMTLSRSEDGGDRSLATPTTLAATTMGSTSASSRAGSRTGTPRTGTPRTSRDASARDSPRGSRTTADGAKADEAVEVADEAGVEAATEGQVEQPEDGVVEEASPSAAPSAQSHKTVSVKEEPMDADVEAGVVVAGSVAGVVVAGSVAGEEEEDGDDDALAGMSACDPEEDLDRQADIERGYMFTQEDFDRIKFEAESVKKMWQLETVEELYALAESIVREMVAQDAAPAAATAAATAAAPAAAPAPASSGERTPPPSSS